MVDLKSEVDLLFFFIFFVDLLLFEKFGPCFFPVKLLLTGFDLSFDMDAEAFTAGGRGEVVVLLLLFKDDAL